MESKSRNVPHRKPKWLNYKWLRNANLQYTAALRRYTQFVLWLLVYLHNWRSYWFFPSVLWCSMLNLTLEWECQRVILNWLLCINYLHALEGKYKCGFYLCWGLCQIQFPDLCCSSARDPDSQEMITWTSEFASWPRSTVIPWFRLFLVFILPSQVMPLPHQLIWSAPPS